MAKAVDPSVGGGTRRSWTSLPGHPGATLESINAVAHQDRDGTAIRLSHRRSTLPALSVALIRRRPLIPANFHASRHNNARPFPVNQTLFPRLGLEEAAMTKPYHPIPSPRAEEPIPQKASSSPSDKIWYPYRISQVISKRVLPGKRRNGLPQGLGKRPGLSLRIEQTVNSKENTRPTFSLSESPRLQEGLCWSLPLWPACPLDNGCTLSCRKLEGGMTEAPHQCKVLKSDSQPPTWARSATICSLCRAPISRLA